MGGASRGGVDGASWAGKVDAFLGFPPEPQELRAKKIGQLVLNTATDKPWGNRSGLFRPERA